jgi:hypothetical protein
MGDANSTDPEDLLDADDDERSRVPRDTYAGIPPAPMPPLAPDGGLVPVAMGNPPPVPPATPELFVCLRGPCRHYWQISSHLVSGNPEETWGEDGLRDERGQPLRAPRQITRACTYQAGVDTQFTDDIVYACNRWDPVLPKDEARLEKRRRIYLKQFPQYASKE